MRNNQISSVDGRFQLAPSCGAITMTAAGLVFSGGSLLMRMRTTAEGSQALAIGADRERMLAMLSIAFGRPFAAADVVPHVETAAYLWRRGDKALANLRLMFASLGGLSDPLAEYRAALAACLLDQGWPPAALLEELGLADSPGNLEKNNPNHVPAGNGKRSGQFDFAPGTARRSDGKIVVAMDDGHEDEETFKEREVSGITSPKEEVDHGRPITPTTGIPIVGSSGGMAAGVGPPSAAAGRQLPAGIGPGPFAGKSVPAGPSPRPDQGKQLEINAIGRDTGCHTCGTTNPGTASGNFIGDHQPPNAVRQSGEAQNYFPHCLKCSRAQGGNVTRFKARGE